MKEKAGPDTVYTYAIIQRMPEKTLVGVTNLVPDERIEEILKKYA